MYAVRTQLSWTHLRSLMSVSNALARQVYMEMCRIEHWVNTNEHTITKC